MSQRDRWREMRDRHRWGGERKRTVGAPICVWLCVPMCHDVCMGVRAQTWASVLTFPPCLGQVSLLLHKPCRLTLEVLETTQTQTHRITGVQYRTQLLHRLGGGVKYAANSLLGI